MELKVMMPPDFNEELEKSIEVVYQRTIQAARTDAGVLKEFLSIQEACEMLDIARNSFTNNYLKKGLSSYKVGGKIFIKKAELNEFIYNHRI